MLTGIFVLGAVLFGGALPATAQQGAAGGEWRSYAADVGGSKYSPLDQIGPDNVHDLRVAWRWRSVDHALADEDPELQFNPTLQATPLMIGGRLFMGTNLGQAAAIDPASGETTWVYRALEDGAGRPRGGSTRGVSFWNDPQRDDARIFIVSGQQLVALDARTGNPLREFGAGGKVDLAAGVPNLERVPLDRGTADLPRHGHNRHLRHRPVREEGAGAGLHPGLRCRHRPAEVDVQHDPAAGRARQRDVGRRFLVAYGRE